MSLDRTTARRLDGIGTTQGTQTIASVPAGVNVAMPDRLTTIVSIQCSVACWVRLYNTPADLMADQSRTFGTPPALNAGLILSYKATAPGLYRLSPIVQFFDNSVVIATDVAANVTLNYVS